MTAWSSPSLFACLLLLSACPTEPVPAADESSTGPSGSTSTGPGPGTTPQPTTVDPDSSSGTTAATSSTGPDDTTGSTGSTGPDDTTGSSGSSGSTGPDDTTGSSGSSGSTGPGSSSGEASTSSTSDTGGSTTTGGDPCDAGDGPDFAVTNNGFTDYVINGVNDPQLTVVRGCSYTFNINAAGHPFRIKTVQGAGAGNSYNVGVVGNGTQNGVITWDVDMAAPDALFYNCEFHPGMTNTITVIDP